MPIHLNNKGLKRVVGGGAALTGLGAGLYGGSKFVLSDEDYDKVKRFNDYAHGSWMDENVDPRQKMMEYVNSGSPLMQTHPFQTSAYNLMHSLRNPKVIDQLGRVNDKVKGFAWKEDDVAHYGQFSKSPLDGYMQLQREMTENPEYTKPLQEAVKNRFKDGITPEHPYFSSIAWDTNADTDGIPESPHQDYLQKLKDNVFGLAKDKHINLDHASSQEKQTVLDNLDNYVRAHDHGLWNQKQYADAMGGWNYSHAGPTYSDLISQPIQNMHDHLKHFGIGAGIVGLGASGAAAYKLLKNHMAKRSKLQNDEKMPLVNNLQTA